MAPEVGPTSEPDQAWKALGLVNDWIKHAEAKVGATLAASGAVAVMLYHLVKNENDPSFWLSAAAVTCAATIVAAGGSATLALIPRLSIVRKQKTRKAQKVTTKIDDELAEVPEDPVNLLFFSNIARHYKDNGPSYVEVLRSMTADPEELTRQIAHQVHANATVAHRKFTWADRAVKLLATALGLLGVVAIVIELKG
ncbi:Pycsar system effector family protein [Amycolatopsis palatopharyngis]|uniref:Pycsar system effector family protein n=1 Tax=Amycolatopsis palatopharyngis TaxID=187982 RepID=UPI0013BE9130|nr:Pycsar system effector family protein [Amycolatopsis palatopharyngis]